VQQFYSSVFGWKLEAWRPPGFFMINAGEAADSEGNVAGAMRYERRA
jgi:predicted enzyme related to lactoylglutathione lyase